MRVQVPRSSFLLRATLLSRRSWTSWWRRSQERKLVKLATKAELHLLAATELDLLAAIVRARLLSAEQLRQLPQTEQQPPPVQPVEMPPLEHLPQEQETWVHPALRVQMPVPSEPMPRAEDQLASLLGGPLTQPTSTPPSQT